MNRNKRVHRKNKTEDSFSSLLKIVPQSDIDAKRVPVDDLWFIWQKEGKTGPFLGQDLLQYVSLNHKFSRESKMAQYQHDKKAEEHWLSFSTTSLYPRLQDYEKNLLASQKNASFSENDQIFLLIKGQKVGPYLLQEVLELWQKHDILSGQLISLDRGSSWIRLGDQPLFAQMVLKQCAEKNLPPLPEINAIKEEQKLVAPAAAIIRDEEATSKTETTNAFPMLKKNMQTQSTEKPLFRPPPPATTGSNNTTQVPPISEREQRSPRKLFYWAGVFVALVIIAILNFIPRDFAQQKNYAEKIDKEEVSKAIIPSYSNRENQFRAQKEREAIRRDIERGSQNYPDIGSDNVIKNSRLRRINANAKQAGLASEEEKLLKEEGDGSSTDLQEKINRRINQTKSDPRYSSQFKTRPSTSEDGLDLEDSAASLEAETDNSEQRIGSDRSDRFERSIRDEREREERGEEEVLLLDEGR